MDTRGDMVDESDGNITCIGLLGVVHGTSRAQELEE